jgi:hypothetical protein
MKKTSGLVCDAERSNHPRPIPAYRLPSWCSPMTLPATSRKVAIHWPVRAIQVRRLDGLAAVGGDLRQGVVETIDPDVGQKARFARVRTAGGPSSRDAGRGVGEARVSRVAVADVPAEDLLVERGRLVYVKCGDFEITEARPGQLLMPPRHLL